MLNLLWLVPAMSFVGFLVLILFGSRLSRIRIALVGAGSTAVSMVMALLLAFDFLKQPDIGSAYTQTLWTWFRVGNSAPSIGFHLDGLSLAMMVVVTVIGFLVHLYSVAFMAGDRDYSRFFAYMNLFMGSMLTLVLADNVLFLYLGWEAVGLCSYLLIGFWYHEPANGRAAMKAFLVTRIGDTFLLIGFLMLFTSFGTFHIQHICEKAVQLWPVGSPVAVAGAVLLLAGAVGKSAQLPLQTWLPDAMAGPSPVSALIHAATMVTAGVYLVARMYPIFMLAPDVRFAMAFIGASTLLLAGTSALAQTDIKRVLAYSTMSQVGYMFLSLGVGAWSAAIFHLVTHAFFKALLFLSAGVVIQSLANEHDIFRMGGLRKRIPVAYWTFLIGAASLSAVPLATAGFYSKDLILFDIWSSSAGGIWFWLAGIAGSVLTSIYAFRVVFVAFVGPGSRTTAKRPASLVNVALTVLAAGAVTVGFVPLPEILHGTTRLAEITAAVLPEPQFLSISHSTKIVVQAVAVAGSLGGIVVAWLLYCKRPADLVAHMSLFPSIYGFWSSGWGFDRIYRVCFVAPFTYFAERNRRDFIDIFYRGCVEIAVLAYTALSLSQSGRVRWYVAGLAFGVAVFLYLAVIL